MSTIDKIVALIKASGFTNAEIAQQLNLNQQVITDWKSGKSQSYKKYLYQLAELLNTTPEYLKGKTDKKEKPTKAITHQLALEQKLSHIGYSIGFYEDDAMPWINYPDGTLEVTDEELRELNASVDSFMRFKLEELKAKHISDFKKK